MGEEVQAALGDRVSTPFDPNNIIVGTKDISIYVGTVLRQFMAGSNHIELKNRGYKGREKLFAILESVGSTMTFSTTTLISKSTIFKSDTGDKSGMDNTLILDR